MKTSKFTEEQVAYALRLSESGTPVADVCRQMGISHERFRVSTARSCAPAKIPRASWYYRSRAKDQSALKMRIREMANTRPRFG